MVQYIRMKKHFTVATALATLVLVSPAPAAPAAEEFALPERVLELPSGKGNPRNSEGDFARLKDGSLLFVYTRYNGNTGADHGAAELVSRVSRDGGRTWSKEDKLEVKNHGGQNVMSVSLLRLKDDRLVLFYLLKNSSHDCRPCMRLSTDEAKTWGEPKVCIADADVDYFVLNNARAIQLKSGRILLPLARHTSKNKKGFSHAATVMTLISDDMGSSWRFSKTKLDTRNLDNSKVITQEPGVVELSDGRVLMWMRTTDHVQYASWSKDGGDTWSKAVPWNLNSPNSPATVERLSNGDLVAVWNDHGAHPEFKDPASMAKRYRGTGRWANGQRTPLTIAVSKNDGRTWIKRRDLECNPDGWFCYVAAIEVDGAILLGYCAKDNLCYSRITRVPLKWLYGPEREDDVTGFFKD